MEKLLYYRKNYCTIEPIVYYSIFCLGYVLFLYVKYAGNICEYFFSV